ncbi:MAG: TrmH family RNA methyltransferase, partial [Bacteroidales bacterium]|nr:TrmH family RNA methyltransferase [Bacteroidales bacterium]
EHYQDTVALVQKLKEEGYTVVSIEQTEKAVQLQDFKKEDGKKYALIFGNEVNGVQQEVVDASDTAIEIPQYGTKHSLNVSVSVGIILWHFRP